MTKTKTTETTDNDNDLFGYKPRKKITCDGCGTRAEPVVPGFCWLCTNTGQRDLVLKTMPPRYHTKG